MINDQRAAAVQAHILHGEPRPGRTCSSPGWSARSSSDPWSHAVKGLSIRRGQTAMDLAPQV